jgi:ubiquinone/menaquinone biosynthesis C-methylase UbiE
MKLYNERAEIYHEEYKEIFDYEEIYSIFNAHLKTHSPKVSKLLELGCGSGSVTEYFMKNYETIGIDLSENMIKIAQKNYPSGNFIQVDMRNLPDSFSDIFDAVVSTGRSFTHLTTNNDCLNCCKSVFKVLKPGGIFIFDNFSANYIFSNFKPTTYQETSKVIRKSTNSPNLEHGFTWNWYAEYEIKDNKGEIIEIFSDYMELRAFTKDEIELFLSLSGFEKIDIIIEDENPLSLLSIGIKPNEEN